MYEKRRERTERCLVAVKLSCSHFDSAALNLALRWDFSSMWHWSLPFALGAFSSFSLKSRTVKQLI